MHAMVCESGWHATPPWATAVATLRERVAWPPPQDFVHADQLAQSPTEQSTGHGCTLHACVSVECPQATPPDDGWRVMDRARICCPAAPHVSVHVVHEPQSLCVQSTGHANLLQVWLSCSVGHTYPP